MADVRRGTVGNVEAFWVESARPTLAASLMFRQGITDEPLPMRGWTHLLEHMALRGRGAGALEVNGSVSLLSCTLDVHGPPDRVADLLCDLTAWLVDPDLGDLERERSVLLAEASLRGGSPVQEALLWRYGAKGPGRAGYTELGLSKAGPSELLDLARRVFVSGNAALFLDGPPPPGLDLTLPQGGLRRVEAAVPLKLPHLGAYVTREAGGVISGVVPRSAASQVLVSVLGEDLTAVLRHEAAGAYAPWCTYEPLDELTALVVAGSDANVELLPRLVPQLVGVLQRLADEGPRADVLAHVRDRMLQGLNDPFAVAVPAHVSAQRHLRGLEPTSREEMAEEIEAVTADLVSRSARAMLRTVLAGVPAGAGRLNGSRDLQMPTRERPDGSVHRARDWPADDSRLILGPRTLSIGRGQDFRAADTDDLAALVRFEDGARVLIRPDGWAVPLEPTLWKDGESVVDRVDRMVPAALHVDGPSRDPAAIPRPLSARDRWRGVRRLVLIEAVLLVLVLGCVAGGVALFLAARDRPDPPAVILPLWIDAAVVSGLLGLMWQLVRDPD